MVSPEFPKWPVSHAVRNTQYEIIQRPYSIIREFETHISVGNKYGVLGIPRTRNR